MFVARCVCGVMFVVRCCMVSGGRCLAFWCLGVCCWLSVVCCLLVGRCCLVRVLFVVAVSCVPFVC